MDVMKSIGGFRFLPADGPFSAGVAAEPGYQIVRVLAPRYTELKRGFALVEKTLHESSRPLAALCAMELRVPKPFTRDGFDEFNAGYIAQHKSWGVVVDGRVPAATHERRARARRSRRPERAVGVTRSALEAGSRRTAPTEPLGLPCDAQIQPR